MPALKDSWVRTPVDAFILQKLTAEKLKPAREADRRTLARRAYLDLHGLPPLPSEQVEKFANDPAPDAYEKLIDELLASPRYGEKWGRHWLDLARYGDTAGFEQDPYLLYAWRYRDYVIDSFNNDKPYDRFVKEQIAGDELYPDDPASMTGTGFYTVGPNRDMLYKVEDINRVETLIDWVDTTGSVFLGLTVGCARCHDHKFDPIPQRDYMALQAIFQNAEKTRVFLQYDPARGYDLQENGRTARLWEIADQFQALGVGGGGRRGAGAAADADASSAAADAPISGRRAEAEGARTAGVADVPQYPAGTVRAGHSRHRPRIADQSVPARAQRPPSGAGASRDSSPRWAAARSRNLRSRRPLPAGAPRWPTGSPPRTIRSSRG